MNSGYPPYPNPQMPSQQGGQPPYSIYPNASPYPPSQPQPGVPGFNTTGFQQSSAYPPQPTPGYPPQQGGYPPQPSSGYPPQPSAAYPPQQPGYPPQQGYPSAAPGYPSQPVTPAYPPSVSPQPPAAYPPSTYPTQPTAAYPPAQPSYPGAPSAAYPTQPQAHAYPSAQPHTPSHYPTQQTTQSGLYQTQGYGSVGYAQSAGQYVEKPAPTVTPISPFNARQDAEVLRKAMKGIGTDEKAIIHVLTKRSNSQRLEIANNFKAMYGKDLCSDLKGELSGKFEDIIVALMTPLPEFLAKEIYHALEGIGTKEDTLVEILCTSSNAQIYAIKDAYQRLIGRPLENDLRGDTSGHFRRLLISVVQGRRTENPMVDEGAAAKDARDLMSAGVLQLGTDESTFNAILCTRSYAHLRRVLMEYQRASGHTLDHAIRSEFSGDIQAGLLAIVKSVEDKPGFFAERLRDAVACAGTKDRQLIRIVVSRCEIDMQEIKRAYQRLYAKSVEQDISDDTSGDYKKTLLSLVGGY